MACLSANERGAFRTISQLCYCNPFLPERTGHERALLGADFLETEADWNMRGDDPNTPLVNAVRLTERIEMLVQRVRERLTQGSKALAEELEFYEDAVFLLLYYRYESYFYEMILHALQQSTGHRVGRFYRAFQKDWEHYFHLPSFPLDTKHDAAHVFACFFQVRRAFHHIFRYLIGGSTAAARLRVAVWQSIFT
jgi:hypothetical protein